MWSRLGKKIRLESRNTSLRGLRIGRVYRGKLTRLKHAMLSTNYIKPFPVEICPHPPKSERALIWRGWCRAATGDRLRLEPRHGRGSEGSRGGARRDRRFGGVGGAGDGPIGGGCDRRSNLRSRGLGRKRSDASSHWNAAHGRPRGFSYPCIIA